MEKDLVVITGVNGFIGFKTLRFALEAGYRVRGTVRREELIEQIKNKESIKPHLDRAEFVIVRDIIEPNAFQGLLNGATYVIHIASPLPGKADNESDLKTKIIDPAVQGTVGMLQAALETPTIKRVVLMSSLSAVASFTDMFVTPTGKLYTHEDRVIDPPYSNQVDAYFASKAAANNAALDFMEKQKPQFDLVSFMPGSVIGAHEMATTLQQIAIPLNIVPLGVLLNKPALPPFANTGVHVDDVADLQVRALKPEIQGNRGYILMSDGSCSVSWSEANSIAEELFPEAVKDGRFPLHGPQLDFPIKYETSDTEKIFNFKFKNYKEQIKNLGTQYLELLSKDPDAAASLSLTI